MVKIFCVIIKRGICQSLLLEGTQRMLGLSKNYFFSGSLMRFFPKPVIRLTDFEIRCFSGIKQAR